MVKKFKFHIKVARIKSAHSHKSMGRHRPTLGCRMHRMDW